MIYRTRFALASFLAILAAASSARGDDLLNQVPRDALGVLLARNLGQIDAKSAKLFEAGGVPLPGVLPLIESVAGVGAGLDKGRDLLMVLLPPENDSRRFHLALWLPVNDYDAFVRSLEGDPARRISAVTIAGEDLLVTRQSDWAVVMDPDQRDRLEGLGNAAASPPQLAEWRAWIESRDVSVVILTSGMRTAWSFVTKGGAGEAPNPPAEVEVNDDLFGAPVEENPFGGVAEDNPWLAAGATFRQWLADMPELGQWVAKSDSAACGIRVDAGSNLVVDVRLRLSEATIPKVTGSPATATSAENGLPPRLDDGGEFVISGAGALSKAWTVPAVGPYVRQAAIDLNQQFGVATNEEEIAAFRGAVQQAVGEATSFAVLTRPGTAEDAIFSNAFLALRVDSPEKFLTRANEAMRQWNAMVAKGEASTHLELESSPITIDGRTGVVHSLDMVKAVNAGDLPESRQAIEKLMGPGGKFRAIFVPVDDHTVLLAVATEEQATKAAAAIRAATPAPPAANELLPTNDLLTRSADWRLFVSQSGYYSWLKREMDAIVGEVIGGPIVREFPKSPPLGLAGGIEGTTVWAEVAVPAETLRATGKHAKK